MAPLDESVAPPPPTSDHRCGRLFRHCRAHESTVNARLVHQTRVRDERLEFLDPPQRAHIQTRRIALDSGARSKGHTCSSRGQDVGLLQCQAGAGVEEQGRVSRQRHQGRDGRTPDGQGSFRDLLKAKLVDLQAKLTELEDFRDTLSGYLEQCEHTLGRGETVNRRGQPDCPVIETLQTKRT